MRNKEQYKKQNKGFKKKGLRHLTVDGVQYSWKITVDKHSIHCIFSERWLWIERTINPGQRILVYAGGDSIYGDNECYYKEVFCTENKEKVKSLKDACCIRIAKSGIDYKKSKLPIELQEYISSLTKLVEVSTNIPRLLQITPKMIRAVILESLKDGWNPAENTKKQWRCCLSCYLQSKEDLDKKISLNPIQRPFVDNYIEII
eukprot:TRINITY_DN908_c0_g1_i1.p1 TRINITY_DN908_c0_g1~~TRINITY_DN908_c0_g1_i1.p1  ORF type:complete len:203 (-),score=13.85 TRINITY_DN908_c0_g1_i1:200-808(-)